MTGKVPFVTKDALARTADTQAGSNGTCFDSEPFGTFSLAMAQSFEADGYEDAVITRTYYNFFYGAFREAGSILIPSLESLTGAWEDIFVASTGMTSVQGFEQVQRTGKKVKWVKGFGRYFKQTLPQYEPSNPHYFGVAGNLAMRYAASKSPAVALPLAASLTVYKSLEGELSK